LELIDFLVSYLADNGGGDSPNGAVGDQGASILNSYITDTKTMLSNLSLSVPVGTADAGAYFNTEVLENVDFAVRSLAFRL
jgi:exo-beta-1,3-glucanase (GH17 family)